MRFDKFRAVMGKAITSFLLNTMWLLLCFTLKDCTVSKCVIWSQASMASQVIKRNAGTVLATWPRAESTEQIPTRCHARLEPIKEVGVSS
uniref:Secreted protein n=1 Tax=Peronospora matthiolae TaxID=2874970 RepID=A0AAV1TD32_9STRA